MKLVFFSTDRVEVELLGKELAGAGIPCEIRNSISVKAEAPRPPETELWVRHDKDCHRAFMFFVERDAGFAKKEKGVVQFEDLWPEEVAA